MAAQTSTVGTKRDYAGSPEKAAGVSPVADQLLSAAEINTGIVTPINDHAALLDLAELKWFSGFTLSHTWVVSEDGSKKPYHAHADSTAEQRAATVPGSNGAVWVASTPHVDTDFVAAYTTAKL